MGNNEADSVAAGLTSLRSGRPANAENESCGDFGIRIGADGTWYYRGSPIGRKPLVKLFATVLNRREDGSYWLTTPVEDGRIEVDDAPFTAVEVMRDGSGEAQILKFRTNLDAEVTLDRFHPLRVEEDQETGEPRPYIEVRDGLEARVLRSVFYHLVEMGQERTRDGRKWLGVWSAGLFFEIGTVDG